MNGYYYDYNKVNIETPEERENKRKRQRRLFSRVFLALFIYTMACELLVTGGSFIAYYLLPAEKYTEIFSNTVYRLLISCAVQYLIAFPLLLLALRGTECSHPKEKSKLSEKNFFLLLFIAEAFMYAGNLIGVYLNQVVENITGALPENDIATYVTEIPLWLTFIVMVVIGPIVEEIIFRKLLIDRLSIYGDRLAILFSAVAFGLLHRNLYQFFYATFIGLVFGYVYTSTRNVKYTVYMHMFLNFMGSVVALQMQTVIQDFSEMLEMLTMGLNVDLVKLLFSGSIMLTYTNVQYGMLIGGIIALVHFVKKKQISISADKEIYLSDKEIIKGGVANTGTILFIISCVVGMILSIIQ